MWTKWHCSSVHDIAKGLEGSLATRRKYNHATTNALASLYIVPRKQLMVVQWGSGVFNRQMSI